MNELKDTLTGRLLGRLADAVIRHPRWFFWPQIVLFLACLVYTKMCLGFDTERSSLVGAERRYHRNYQEFRKDFHHVDDMAVVVESEDAEKNRQFVERLGAKLEAETNLFAGVFFKGDLKMMGSKALLFVPVEDLRAMQQRLKDYRPFIQKFTAASNLVTLVDLVNTGFRTATREENAENKSLMEALPALERIMRQAEAGLARRGEPPSPGVNALFGAQREADQRAYITFNDGRIYLVTAQARTRPQKGAAVDRLNQLVEETRVEVPGVNVGITGEPVLEHDEMIQTQRDSTWASVLSLVLCALIFVYGYHESGRPLKAVMCLVVGIGYTLGFATLAIGQLNILTTSFVPILIGLAIDFGVHLITRYEEELRHGHTEHESLKTAMMFTGQGIFTGAFTTAGGFLAMGLTDFRGIREMGIICGGGLLICLVPMLTLLPVLLLRGRQNKLDHDLGESLDRRARIEQVWLRRPVRVILLTFALCAVAVSQFGKVNFDYNLLNLQSKGLPAVVWERKLIANTTNTAIYGMVLATNLDQAPGLEKRILQLACVDRVQSLSRFLTENQDDQLALVGEIKRDLAGLEFPAPDARTFGTNALDELSRSLWALQGYCDLALEEIRDREPELRLKLTALRDAIGTLRVKMHAGNLDVNGARLGAFQRALFTDLQQTFATIVQQDNQSRLRVEDLPDSLRNRFVGASGRHLLMVYPKRDLWQRENQAEFVGALRQALDPLDTNSPVITGAPVQLYEYTGLLRSSCEEAALYSLAAISLLTLIHFRSLTSIVLALLPVAIGSIWLGGFMGLLSIPFNPANILILPLVIGIGVTNGIHILNRFAEEHNPGILGKSTGKAVLISGLTTIAGFGSLMIAKHQGIASLGYVMAIGTATCMMAGLTFLPAVLNLIQRLGKKQPSVENALSTLGREEPRQKPSVKGESK
jgi:hopanoid biosynthesis associated RND transporter like protein HpnN